MSAAVPELLGVRILLCVNEADSPAQERQIVLMHGVSEFGKGLVMRLLKA